MAISFIITYVSLPKVIAKLRKTGNVVPDHYKIYKPDIPTQGGLVVLFSTFFAVITMSLWYSVLDRYTGLADIPQGISETDMAIMLVIAMFGIFGIFDDLIDVGHLSKVILPFFFAYPLLSIITPEHLTIPIYGDVDFESYREFPFVGKIYVYTIARIIIMPIFIIGVTNLVNMHSGFNGLQTGLSCIILLAIIIKSIMIDKTQSMLVPASVLGGLIAFWFFSKYPAQILEGNIGSLFFGPTIGCILVVQGLFIFGCIIFIPHILDFILFAIVRLRKQEFVKFGRLRWDGNIEAPNPLKLKFLLPYYFNLTERQIVIYLYGLTGFFCIVGLIIT